LKSPQPFWHIQRLLQRQLKLWKPLQYVAHNICMNQCLRNHRLLFLLTEPLFSLKNSVAKLLVFISPTFCLPYMFYLCVCIFSSTTTYVYIILVFRIAQWDVLRAVGYLSPPKNAYAFSGRPYFC
jgi:hypothetical protein